MFGSHEPSVVRCERRRTRRKRATRIRRPQAQRAEDSQDHEYLVALPPGDGLYVCMSLNTPPITNERTLQLLDISELAAQLSVSPRFVRRLVTERRIPYRKVGKFVRFDVAEVADWVADRRMDALR